MNDDNEYKYVLAYALAILLLVLLIRTRIGYKIVYYALLLSLFLVLVNESTFIARTLAPISGIGNSIGQKLQ